MKSAKKVPSVPELCDYGRRGRPGGTLTDGIYAAGKVIK